MSMRPGGLVGVYTELLLACGAWAAVLAIPGARVATARPPNVVILYADDLGYGDPRCYNPDRGRIPTPHIDRLAATGMRFTDGHSSSGVCSPSRYTLLTGRYHWRTRLQSGIVSAWESPLIAPDRLTVAGLAKEHGFRTACIGKWHLGMDWALDAEERKLVSGFGGNPRTSPGESAMTDVTDAHREAWRRIFARPIAGGPTTRGFDVYVGTNVPNWPPYCFIENDRTIGITTTLLPKTDFQHNRASTQGPALEGWRLEDVLPTLRDRAVAFIEESAKDGMPFLLYMPLTTPHTPLAVNEAWKGKSGLGNACADLIMETDAVVGDVLTALDRTGQTATTLVIFSSDNGFAPYVGATELERQGHFPSGPFRGYKGSAWEGGHRVPFIVRYPGVTRPGAVCEALVHQADVMATLADVLGTNLPDMAGEDSFSLVPLLRGGAEPIRHHAVSCSSAGAPAIRSGRWKLILGLAPKGQQAKTALPPIELYDLAVDPGEMTNLAADHPERVAELRAAYATLVANGRSTPGASQRNDVKVLVPQ